MHYCDSNLLIVIPDDCLVIFLQCTLHVLYRIGPKSELEKSWKKFVFFQKMQMQIVQYPRYTFLVIVQLILILYFQIYIQNICYQKILAKNSNNDLIRRVILTY